MLVGGLSVEIAEDQEDSNQETEDCCVQNLVETCPFVEAGVFRSLRSDEVQLEVQVDRGGQ